jgi:hypothetical protein
MAGNDDDKPKRSWREIDAMRDKSGHRKEGGGGSGGGSRQKLERSQAYRSYKTQLNKLFDGGGLPDALKAKLEDKGIGTDAKRRRELAQAVVAASGPTAIRAALAEYRAAFGAPDEEDVLARLLELEDDAVVLETLATIDRLHGEGTLKRGSSLKARVKTVQMTLDSPRVVDAARALLAKL